MSRSRLLPALLLLLLVAGLYERVLFRGELLLGSGTDLLSAAIPYRSAARERLLDGELPLWSPGHFGGMPLLAGGQSGAAYPPFWLLLPFSPERALSLSLVLHVLLAALGAWLLTAHLQSRGRPSPAPGALSESAGPLVAGALVAFGGSVQGHVFAGHANLVESFAWLPLALWALDRLLLRPSARRAAALALVLGLQGLAGHPQISVLTFLAVLVWTAFALLAPGQSHRQRAASFLWLLAAGLLAACVAALVLLPMAELAGHSHRSLTDDPWSFANRFKAPPVSLLNLFLPHPFGLPSSPAQESWWAAFGKWEPQGWTGGLAIALALVALAARPDRSRWALALIALLGVLFALGDSTPLYRAAATVAPVLESLRVPARFLMLAGLALPVLAGLGLDSLLHPPPGGRHPLRLRLALAIPLVAAILFCVGLSASFGPTHAGETAEQWLTAHGSEAAKGSTALRDDVGVAMRRATREAGLALALGGTLALLLAFPPAALRQRASLRLALGGALGVILTLEALAFGQSFVVSAAKDPRPPLSREGLATLRERCRTERIVWSEQRRWNVGLQHSGLRGASGYDPALTWWTNDILNLDARRMRDEQSTARARQRLWMLWPGPRSLAPTRAWEALSVRCVLSARADLAQRWPGALRRETARAEIAGAHLYTRESPPRAAFVSQAEVIAEPAARLTRLARPDFDLSARLVLEAPPPESNSRTGAPGTVEWQRDDPEHLIFALRAPTSGWLRLADTWYPGWEARVDGEEAPVLRANHAFRAVPVPAGEHTVELRYRPLSVRAGAATSALGLLTCLALIFIRRRRKAPL